MDIKMIVIDLDQTLLCTDKTISDYSIDILTRCRQAGKKNHLCDCSIHTGFIKIF